MTESKDCRTAIVTGSSRGIGFSIAEKLYHNNYIVYGASRSTQEQDTFPLKERLLETGRFIQVSADITDSNSLKNLCQTVWKKHKRLDVLINNAGIVSYEPFSLCEISAFKKMLEVNVIGTLELTQYASRLMMKRKSGSIINVSSVVASKGVSGQVAYSTTKGAIISFTKSLAKELAADNIRVNCIAPGMINTERFSSELTRFPDKAAKIRMGRLGTPEDVADCALFLASEASSYITGQIIEVDGSLDI